MSTDPFDLARFLSAQDGTYPAALSELRRGQKRTHWMWFIFPQIEGLGSSPTARRYAVKSLAEAKAYLSDPILGPRLIECCEALLEIQDRSAFEIFGPPDDLKLKSSMTLFSEASGEPIFAKVLQSYFAGGKDPATLKILLR